MKKSHKILLGVGAGVLVLGGVAAVAGPAIYRDLIAAPAAEAPTLGGGDVPAESQAVASLAPEQVAGEWSISEGSEAGYRVDEVLNGTDVTVTGRTPGVTGSFTVGADGLSLDAASVVVDVASITTDSGSRDAYFRDQALRTSEFPEATFTLTEPATVAQLPRAGETVEATATGELTLAGQTRPVTVRVELRSDGTTAELAGSIPITFADYGVTAPDLGFVSVEPEGFVEFQLVATR
ncbi:YceI family protein [Leucobacter albus]|uniref:YceI family protein n=1 Tax=Leucobacter albus TaxID=272210 RepID=A0ABW3TNV3_9MICO